jgi:hypothetical protein
MMLASTCAVSHTSGSPIGVVEVIAPLGSLPDALGVVRNLPAGVAGAAFDPVIARG